MDYPAWGRALPKQSDPNFTVILTPSVVPSVIHPLLLMWYKSYACTYIHTCVQQQSRLNQAAAVDDSSNLSKERWGNAPTEMPRRAKTKAPRVAGRGGSAASGQRGVSARTASVVLNTAG